jgi:uncharacterized protein YidB (DUF937 family)
MILQIGIAPVTRRRKTMATSEDVIRSAVPGGIAKPLILALLALLASGALFGGGGKGSSATKGSQPAPDEGHGGLLGGLGGLVDKLQKGGLGNVVNQNQPVSPNQLGPALGPDIIKTLAQRSGLSEEELIRQLSQVLPGLVDKLTPNGRLPTLAEVSQLR